MTKNEIDDVAAKVINKRISLPYLKKEYISSDTGMNFKTNSSKGIKNAKKRINILKSLATNSKRVIKIIPIHKKSVII